MMNKYCQQLSDIGMINGNIKFAKNLSTFPMLNEHLGFSLTSTVQKP